MPAGGYVVIGSKEIVSADEIRYMETSPVRVGISGGILTVAGSETGYCIFSLDGRKIDSSEQSEATFRLPSGLYLVRASDGTHKVSVR